MSFIDEHPDYQSYVPFKDYHFHDVPSSVWTPLESLVEEAGGDEGENLVRVVLLLARKIRFGYIDPSFACQEVPNIISRIRKKVEDGKFDLFMDCLATLCVKGDLATDVLNDFLEEHSIGYRIDYRPHFSNAHWEKVESEDEALENDQSKIPPGRIMKEEKKVANITKTTKIFITNSSEDKEYVLLLTELLRSIKVESNNIICTTDPIHRIPNGKNAFDWLKSQFMNYDLHMIFILSEKYFGSVPCLNEMGAAWLVAKRSDVLLLPSFGFKAWKEKSGCLSSDIQAGSLDSDDITLKAWLNDLKNGIITEFGLNHLNDLEWEKCRDDFIKNIRNIKNASPALIEEPKSSKRKNDVNPIVKAITEAGGEVKGISSLATTTGLTESTVKRYIQLAIDNGKIEKIGSRRSVSLRLKSKS